MVVSQSIIQATILGAFDLVLSAGNLVLAPRKKTSWQSVGNGRYGPRKADVLVHFSVGKPHNPEEYEEEMVSAGEYLFHVYMKISGTWKKKISGNGIIVYSSCNVYGPLCPYCKKEVRPKIIKGFWGDKRVCSYCEQRFWETQNLNSVANKLSRSLNEIIPKSIGLS